MDKLSIRSGGKKWLIGIGILILGGGTLTGVAIHERSNHTTNSATSKPSLGVSSQKNASTNQTQTSKTILSKTVGLSTKKPDQNTGFNPNDGVSTYTGKYKIISSLPSTEQVKKYQNKPSQSIQQNQSTSQPASVVSTSQTTSTSSQNTAPPAKPSTTPSKPSGTGEGSKGSKTTPSAPSANVSEGCNYTETVSQLTGTTSMTKVFHASTCAKAEQLANVWATKEDKVLNKQPTTTTTTTPPPSTTIPASSQPSLDANGCPVPPANFATATQFYSWWGNLPVSCQTNTFTVDIANQPQSFSLTGE